MTRQYQTSALSRERNRIHARKTRQRKKEQMQLLTSKAEGLKQEQLRLKQCINEKNTASILVGLFSRKDTKESASEDPRIEELLKRTPEDIPDADKLPELPALILPGQHNCKKRKHASIDLNLEELPNDGIDYELLGKDRSKCSPEELDQIRRERNRMHAKRTRDRKRHFMEEVADLCKRLEQENILLHAHLDKLNGRRSQTDLKGRPSSVISPTLSYAQHQREPSEMAAPLSSKSAFHTVDPKPPVSQHGVTFDQIKTLLEAANTFSSSTSTTASAVSASTNASDSESMMDPDDERPNKRGKGHVVTKGGLSVQVTTVPNTITTNARTAVGC